MAHENIWYEERAVGWTDEKLMVAINANDTVQMGAHTNTRKTVTSTLMKVSSEQNPNVMTREGTLSVDRR
jgi:hypothetical protein